MRRKRPTSPSTDAAKPARSSRRLLARSAAVPADFFEALAEAPLPAQLSFLRRLLGISQADLAAELKMNQGYLSRLEAGGTGHHLSHFLKVAKSLGARIVALPRGAQVVWNRSY